MSQVEQALDKAFKEMHSTIKWDYVNAVSLDFEEEVPSTLKRFYVYDDELDAFGYRNEIYTDGKLEVVDEYDDGIAKVTTMRISDASYVVKLDVIMRKTDCGGSTMSVTVYGRKDIYDAIKDYLEKLSKKLDFELDT